MTTKEALTHTMTTWRSTTQSSLTNTPLVLIGTMGEVPTSWNCLDWRLLDLDPTEIGIGLISNMDSSSFTSFTFHSSSLLLSLTCSHPFGEDWMRDITWDILMEKMMRSRISNHSSLINLERNLWLEESTQTLSNLSTTIKKTGTTFRNNLKDTDD